MKLSELWNGENMKTYTVTLLNEAKTQITISAYGFANAALRTFEELGGNFDMEGAHLVLPDDIPEAQLQFTVYRVVCVENRQIRHYAIY